MRDRVVWLMRQGMYQMTSLMTGQENNRFFSFFYHTVMPWVAQRSDRKNYQPLRQRSFVMPTSTHVTNSRVVDSSVDNVWKQV